MPVITPVSGTPARTPVRSPLRSPLRSPAASAAAVRRCGRVGFGVIAFAVTTTLAACGSPSSTASVTTSADGASGTGSPLADLFSASGASQRAMEDGIAACMRSRGWQYTPNAALAPVTVFGGAGDPKFREQYGYGISTQPPAGSLVGGAGGAVSVSGSAADDPNAEYIKTLSEADRARYDKDLFGAPAAGASAADGSAQPIQIGGPDADPNTCLSQAQQAVAKTHPEMSDAYNKRVGELTSSMTKDPKMAAALTRWSQCMARSRWVYPTQEAAFADLQTRYDQILGIHSPTPGAVPQSEVVDFGTTPTTVALNPDQQAKVAKLQVEEKAIAKADAACETEHLAKVRRDLEQDVVAKIRSEFPGIGGGK